MRNPRSILITGASSGIGAALARDFAAPGVTLYLGGRDLGRLDAVARECKARGADARTTIIDVVDAPACERWVSACDAIAPLDLVIANAGISAGTGGKAWADEVPDLVRRIFAVNVDGTINTVLPAVAAMRPRKRGQVAIVSSLASFIGTPGSGAYAASKAAQRIWGESLRAELHADGLEVSVICPGFIHTPMTAGNNFPMPFVMSADRAARIIRKGLAANRGRIAFPWAMYFLVWLSAALPPALTERVTRRFPRKD